MDLDILSAIINWFVVVTTTFRYLDANGLLADGDGDEIDRDIHKESVKTRIFVRDIMTNRVICRDMIRMSETAFYNFCDLLAKYGDLRSNKFMNLEEQVAMFLFIVGHKTTNRVVQRVFGRSGEVISRHFHEVLQAVLQLEDFFIRQPDGSSTPSEILDDPNFYPYFQNCIGAIDGTHVRVKVPALEASRYRGRKDYTTQNVFAACTFDLRFTYVLAGWEGTASDARILKNALRRQFGLKIPRGKYYLGDAGFPVMTSVVPPYNSVLGELSSKFPHIVWGKDKVKNRLKYMKAKFSECYDSFRNLSKSGFGFNPITKKFEVEDDVWAEIIKANPKAEDWKDKPMPLFEKLQELFGKDRATGDNAVTAAEVRARRKQVVRKQGQLIEDIDQLVSQNDLGLEALNEFNIGSSQTTPGGKEVAVEINASHQAETSAKPSKRKKRMDAFLESCNEMLSANIDKVIASKKSLDPNDVQQCLVEIDFDNRFWRKAYFHLCRNRVDYDILIALPAAERASALWDILVEANVINKLEPSPYDHRFM